MKDTYTKNEVAQIINSCVELAATWYRGALTKCGLDPDLEGAGHITPRAMKVAMWEELDERVFGIKAVIKPNPAESSAQR